MDVRFAIASPIIDFKNELNSNKSVENLITTTPYASFTTKTYHYDFKFGTDFFPIGGLVGEYKLSNSLYGNQIYKVDLLFANVCKTDAGFCIKGK
jgi:hypothetical protein